jgi:hypothetical protein
MNELVDTSVANNHLDMPSKTPQMPSGQVWENEEQTILEVGMLMSTRCKLNQLKQPSRNYTWVLVHDLMV